MSAFLTILSHRRLLLAKRWLKDGTIANYDESKYYSLTARSVTDISTLSAELTLLESDRHSAVIRGEYVGHERAAEIDGTEHKPNLVRKIKALYLDTPQPWALIEVDKFGPTCDPVDDPEGAITQYIEQHLPPEFQGVSYHWQLSSSAGHPSSAGVLKAHLWFWLSQPVTAAQLKAWATPAMGLDSSVFNTVQFHYTSAPVAEAGVTIPVPVRSGLCSGMFGDEVVLAGVSFANSATNSIANDFAIGPLTGADVDFGDLMTLSATLSWTLDEARTILFGVNADSDRATWVSDLAALHHETNGSAEGLALATEWSATAKNFSDAKDVADRWASFGNYRGNQITGKWLIKRRSECQSHLKYTAKTELAALLTSASDEFALREKVCPQIAKDTRLDDMGREALAQMLFESFKRLGTKYPIAQCRKLLTPKPFTKQGVVDREVPEWAKNWVYVTSDDAFFRTDSEEWLTLQGFNAKFNRELPRDEDGAIEKSASWTAVDDIQVPIVTKALYLPWAGPTFELYGVECVNTYRPSTTPTPVATLSPAGIHAVNVVKRHFKLLAGDRPEVVATLIDWMAHNVQSPGVKIRWAPLWKGVEGDGKTVMGSLLASVMGRINVKNVSSKVLGTDFTGWAQGAAVAVLEEIKLTGHNRYDILNALKPYITNDSIEVHSKGKDGFDAINTTNYIAFTNHADALPLTDTDRRWWIVFTPFATSAEMAKAVKSFAPSLGAYFDELHEVIQKHPAELRRWLLDHSISSTFKPNGSAPMTAEKGVMIGMSISDEQSSVQALLDTCWGPNHTEADRVRITGVTPEMFSSSAMSEALVMSEMSIAMSNWEKNKLFSKMGFMKVGKRTKWNGEWHVIWSKNTGSNMADSVYQILNKTKLTQTENVQSTTDSENYDFFG